MADSRSYPKPASFSHQQPVRTNHSRTSTLTNRICKSIVFVLFLVAIPLFPSQAPSFINQSLLTKFWELLHLLFIGVAVSYGLFSYRNVEGDFDATNYSSTDFDDSLSSNNYVSRIFHVSPIFEDGSESENLYEKDVYQSWDSQLYRGESNVTVKVSNGSSFSIDEQGQNEFINYKDGGEIPLEHDENSGVQAWSSQYFQGESMAVLSQVNYELDEWGKHSQAVAHKPLGLSIRNLKSRIRNPDGSLSTDESESGSSLIGASSSSARSIDEKNLGDTGTINLQENFDENFALHSQVPWRSRSGELREKVGHVASHSSHFRPLSVDESQFESLKSQSFRSTASFSSQASSISNSPTILSPSHSTSSDSPSSRTEELGKNKEFLSSYHPVSQSPQTIKTRDAPLNAFHLRRYSNGSLFRKDLSKRLKDEPKDLGQKRREEGLLVSKESGQGGSLESVKKPATMVKAMTMGKSVRTIRGGICTTEAAKTGEMNKTYIDEKAGKGYDEIKTANIGKNETKGDGNSNISTGVSKKNVDTGYDVPKATFGKYQMKEKEEALETVTAESEQDSLGATDKSRVNSGEDVAVDAASDAWLEPSEVDRKAGEFIAKFREQIRLQKVASVERSKGSRLSGKHLR